MLVLIPKDKGDPDSSSAYRPLSLMSTYGKLAELLLRPRFFQAIKSSEDFSEHQHGFRKEKSTTGAIKEVIAAVE